MDLPLMSIHSDRPGLVSSPDDAGRGAARPHPERVIAVQPVKAGRIGRVPVRRLTRASIMAGTRGAAALKDLSYVPSDVTF